MTSKWGKFSQDSKHSKHKDDYSKSRSFYSSKDSIIQRNLKNNLGKVIEVCRTDERLVSRICEEFLCKKDKLIEWCT